jgi:hypothetical protein
MQSLAFPEAASAVVVLPGLFACPAQKTHQGGSP